MTFTDETIPIVGRGYRFANVNSMADVREFYYPVPPEPYTRRMHNGVEYVLLGSQPGFGNPSKGRGRGADRGSVKSWSLPLEGAVEARKLPPIEVNGGHYDKDRIAHFPSKEAYKQYAKRTETAGGEYEHT